MRENGGRIQQGVGSADARVGTGALARPCRATLGSSSLPADVANSLALTFAAAHSAIAPVQFSGFGRQPCRRPW